MSKEKIKLEVEKRKILGKKVKKLRREGILPANIYGKDIKSLAVQLPVKDFLAVYQKAGETKIIELRVKGEEKDRSVLIRNPQFDPVSDSPLHVDFYQVSLREKIIAKIPVEITGVSPAVEQKIGILIQPLSEIEIEALPADLPEKFVVDVSKLKGVGEAITVADLEIPKGVEIITSSKEIIAKIEAPSKEEAPSEEGKEEGEMKTAEEEKEERAEEKKEETQPSSESSQG